jgi:hypothetical protein
MIGRWKNISSDSCRKKIDLCISSLKSELEVIAMDKYFMIFRQLKKMVGDPEAPTN